METYDVIVIGAGSAGFHSAEVVATAKKKICLIEQERMGGECPNWACIPSKTLLRSAKAYYEATHTLKALGVHASSVLYSFRDIMNRKDAVVEVITGKGKRLETVAQDKGIHVVKGTAVFVDPHTIRVGKKKYTAKKIIIATGTVPFIPPIDGINTCNYLTFRDVVSLKKQPKSIAIIGAGPVGCEFATFFRLLNTRVILFQASEQILDHEDSDIAAIAHNQLVHIGTEVKLKTKVLSVKREGKKTRLTYQTGTQKRQSVLVEQVFVATGKRAHISELSLEKAGVILDKQGRLITDVYQRTNQKHIFAAGDVDGGMQFTHTAHEEGSIAAYNALSTSTRSMKKRDMRVVPRVTFVYPEVASVGITLKEVQDPKNIRIAKFPVGALGRAVADNQRVGLLKLIVEKKSGKILGGHMIGMHAGEVIHEIALAMYLGATAQDLAGLIHAFPTYSEAISAVVGSLE